MKYVFLILPMLLLSSCQTSNGTLAQRTNEVLSSPTTQSIFSVLGGSNAQSALSVAEIALGLREALSVGTQNVTSQLGAKNGFNLDPKIRIPLPEQLQKVDNALSLVGLNGLTSDLETKLNRAAELAAPKAKNLFLSAISQMTINDAVQIFNGPSDAATQFFRRTMGAQLGQEISPIIQSTLQSAGAVQAYDHVMGQYAQLPLVSNVKADLNSYVVDKALDGIFYYVAQEEAAIRANPAARTTEILKRVFGSQS